MYARFASAGIVGCSEEDAVAFMLAGILDLGLMLTVSHAFLSYVSPCTPCRYAPLGVHSDRMLSGACNPMSCPIYGADSGKTTQLQIASLSMSLPDFAAPQLARRKYSIGAVSPSAAIRPLYCELELQPQPDGTLGFIVNTQGPEPLVDTVDDAVTDIKPGDVVKSINGDEVNNRNVAQLMQAAVSDPPVTIDVIRYMMEDGGLAGAEKHFDLLTRYGSFGTGVDSRVIFLSFSFFSLRLAAPRTRCGM